MEWSKLKNIIILMLAAVNVMLLVLVLSRQWESPRAAAWSGPTPWPPCSCASWTM